MLVTAHPPAERSNMVPSRISVLLVLEKKTCMSTGMRGYSRHSIIQSPIRFEVSLVTVTTCSRQLGAPAFCHITMRNCMTGGQKGSTGTEIFRRPLQQLLF